MSNSKQETINPSSKILVLVQEGRLSKELYSRLSQMEANGIGYDIQLISDARQIHENVEEILVKINNGNFNLVLVDRNAHLPIWAIIDQSTKKLPELKFYLDGKAEDIMTREMEFTNFAGALGIVKDGQMLFQAAQKEANKSKISNQSFPNNMDTRFNIASVSKMLTAVAVLQVAKKKGIELKKSLNDILMKTSIRELVRDDYPDKDIFANFTLHELLTHTSGLNGGVEEPFFRSDMMFFEKLEEFKPWIEKFVKDKNLPERHAEKKHVYSNPGYNLLGLAIEAITDKTYYQFVQEYVLKPANMVNTVPQVENANPIYAVNHTRKPTGFQLGGENLSLDIVINSIAQMKIEEKNQEILQLIEQVQNLIRVAQELITNVYPKIEELSSNLESKLISHPQDFLKLKQEYAEQIQKISLELDSKFPYLLESMQKYNESLDDWFKKNHEWIDQNPDDPAAKNAFKLRELFAYTNLPAHIEWPYETLGSFINHFAIASPAGKWRSTVGDLILFNHALWDEKGALADCANYLIEHALKVSPNEKYGYGIVVKNDEEMTALGHTGSMSGACSSSFYYPNQKFIVVTLVNDDDSVGLFMAFDAIEKHLVYGTQNGIVYLDERINSNGENLFMQEVTPLVTQSNQKKINAQDNKPSKKSFTAKMAMMGMVDVSTEAELEAEIPKDKPAETKVDTVFRDDKKTSTEQLPEDNKKKYSM